MFLKISRSFRAAVSAMAGAALFCSAASAGNIYPTNLGQSTNLVDKRLSQSVTLEYLLNDNATGVTVEVLNSSNTVVRTINAGAQPKGTHSVVWDATDDSSNLVPADDYTFRVNTTGAASGAWTRYDTDGTLNNFELPRGVAVNNNPDSPYYGRVYVSNGRSSPTAAGRAMSDGVYMLNADMTDTGIPGGTGPHTAGITTFPTSDAGGTGPFRLEVGPDDSLYITDWSDSHSDLWQTDPNVTTAVQALDSTGRDAAGLNATHGSIADVIVTGTGASRTIYTFDEDYDAPAPADPTPGSILRYDIGNATTFVGPPSGFAYDDTAANRVQNFQGSIDQASDGTFWLSQVRSGNVADTLTSLMQIDATGNVLWSSVPDLAANSLDDPLRGTQGIAYDPVNNLIALVSNRTGGVITIFDPVSKTVLTTFNFGSTTNTDVAFDNAGNLYVGNRSAERVRLWGPPNGGRYVDNAFATHSAGPLGVITVVPEPSTLALLGLALLGVGAVRRRVG